MIQVKGGSIDTKQSAELTSLYFVYLLLIFLPVCWRGKDKGGTYTNIAPQDDPERGGGGEDEDDNDTEDEGGIVSKFMHICSWPFQKVFKLTVPEMPDEDGDEDEDEEVSQGFL